MKTEKALRHSGEVRRRRLVLRRTIEKSEPAIRNTFARNLILISFILEQDHESENANELVRYSHDDVLKLLAKKMKAPKWTDDPEDEASLTSLVRAFFMASGGKVESLLGGVSADEVPIKKNAALWGSIFGIAKLRSPPRIDEEALRAIRLRSKILDAEISIKLVEILAIEAKIDLSEEKLHLPRPLLDSFSIAGMWGWQFSLKSTYQNLPKLQQSKFNPLLLFLCYPNMSRNQQQSLSDWAKSEEGRKFYANLVEDIQNGQTPEQLTLMFSALTKLDQLIWGPPKAMEKPVSGSYLTDLDHALACHGESRYRAAYQRVVQALLRRLNMDQFLDPCLMAIPAAVVVDQKNFVQHFSDGHIDQYIARRSPDLSHRMVNLCAIVESFQDPLKKTKDTAKPIGEVKLPTRLTLQKRKSEQTLADGDIKHRRQKS